MLTIANLRDHLYITLALVGGDEWGGGQKMQIFANS